MKKLLMTLLSLSVILAACTPGAPTEDPLNNPDQPTPSSPKPTPTRVPVDLTPAERAAIEALSEKLGMPADEIGIVSTEAVEWPDGCLGVQRLGMMCTQAIVPGFKIILEAGGKQYEYHTNQNGSSVVLAQSPLASGSVVDVVIKQLAENLGLSESDISVVSDAAVEFADACLDVAMPEVMCAQVITPGHIIVLEAKGIQYEYHTNEDGSRIQPATFAFIWKREGGIAGFCDNLTVFLSGEVYDTSCINGDTTMGRLSDLISADEIAQLDDWMMSLGQVSIDASDPQMVADRMVVTLTLMGTGSRRTVSDQTRQDLLEFAQSLHGELNRK